MPIGGDPVEMVMGLDKILQLLSRLGDASLTKGKVVILGYFVHVWWFAYGGLVHWSIISRKSLHELAQPLENIEIRSRSLIAGASPSNHTAPITPLLPGNREKFSATQGVTRKSQAAHMGMVENVGHPSKTTHSKRAFAHRLICEKGWHGGNRDKSPSLLMSRIQPG